MKLRLSDSRFCRWLERWTSRRMIWLPLGILVRLRFLIGGGCIVLVTEEREYRDNLRRQERGPRGT